MRDLIQRNGRDRGDAGIAIGPILFVIAILGILAAAISASSGFFASSTSSQSAKLMAQTILSQAVEYRDALSKLRSNGCADWEIGGVEDNGTRDLRTELNGPDSCNLFKPSGGGMVLVTFPKEILDQLYRGEPINPSFLNWQFNALRVLGLTPDNEMQMGLKLRFLRTDVCVELNNLVGVENPGGNPPTGEPDVVATSVPGGGLSTLRFGIGASAYAFQKGAFCYYNPVLASSFFYYLP